LHLGWKKRNQRTRSTTKHLNYKDDEKKTTEKKGSHTKKNNKENKKNVGKNINMLIKLV